MDNIYTDELYEILDELNTRVEEIVSECTSPEVCELVIPKIRQKATEFVNELEHEFETIELIDMGA